MDPTDPRLWFGGGGGGAHQDEARLGTAGAPGGGAILICAPRIQFDDGTLITAAGATVTDIAAHNGAAGGGGGGTILLLCNELRGTGRLQVHGGGGGFVDRSDPQPCGPGGGGGGGHIATTLSSIRASTQLYFERGAAGENQGYTDVRRYWYAEPGMRGALTTDLQWTVQPPPAPFKLVSDGDRDLGVLPLGSTFTTTFRVWNVGDEPALVTGIFFEEFKLRAVSTSPFPPAYLNPGDTMVVVASGTVRGGEEFDALTVDVNRTCGATAYLVAERQWRSTEDASCVARIRIAAEDADVGGQQIIHVVLEDDSLLATESTWRLGLLADRRVLHMKGAMLVPRRGGSARIMAYREQGDAASLILEGAVVRTSDTTPDTLATISVLGLFGERWTTPVVEDPLEPVIWSPACATTVIPDTVNLGEVCATRSLRMVSFDSQPAITVHSAGDHIELRRAGPASGAVVWQIFNLQGALVGSGQLSETSSPITLARGVYVVVFHWGTLRTTTMVLH